MLIKKIDLEQKSWQWVSLFFLAFVWGSSFILMKRGLESYSSGQVAAIRIFISFVVLLPFIIKRIRLLTRENVLPLALVGILGNALPAYLFTIAQTEISSTLAGMLNSLVPIFALTTGIAFYKSKTKWKNVLGLTIGLLGAVLLIYQSSSGNLAEGRMWFSWLIVLATLCYGISLNEVKYNLSKLDGLTVAALAFLFVGPIAGVYLIFSDFSSVVSTDNYVLNFGYIAMLAFFSSVVAVVIFNFLIKYTTILFAASVTYIIPIFAVLWGVFDGETISLLQIISGGIILSGVYLINKT